MNLKYYYIDEYHSKIPHIVKFSGGRSSGALLFSMLKNGLLQADRGDVIVFNNTSAEHRKTYEFVMKCKKRCEEEYNIPFFVTEFQTYEDKVNGMYDRVSSFRLVNSQPYSESNPNGYHSRGEVFEELISWQGYLPSLMRGRTCTKKMKMDTTVQFLNDWFMYKEFGINLSRLGHFGTESRINKKLKYQKHEKNGGGVPFDIYFDKKTYCYSRPLFRAEQNFQDYTNVKIETSNIYSTHSEIEYCSFIGFRADEPQRLVKMKNRIDLEINNDIGVAYLRENNEHIYTPLVEFGITQTDVKEFWDNQDWGLDLPYDGSLGNCVYCFMKGGNKLSKIETDETDLTPENIDWWIYIEKKYQRDLVAEKRDIRNKKENTLINFFGINGKVSYEIIKNSENKKFLLNSFDNIPLDSSSILVKCLSALSTPRS